MSKYPVDRRAYDDDRIASAWSDSANEALPASGELMPRPRVARAMELMHLTPGPTLLDIACGWREVSAQAIRADVDATGLVCSDAYISYAAKVSSAGA